MPTYEYSCNLCGTYRSVHRTYKDNDGGIICFKCNIEMVRMFSAPAIVFKGSGWAGKSK